MQKTRTINLPAAGAAPVVIRCTMMTRKMSIAEDASANAGIFQGLVYQVLHPTGFGQFTADPAVSVPPNELLEPIVFEGAPNDHDPNAPPIGNGGSSPNPVSPGGPVTLGTVVCQMTSFSANPTVVNVTEWN